MPRRIYRRHAKICTISTTRKSAVPSTHPSAGIEAADTPSITSPAARPHIAERQEARRRRILDTVTQLFFTEGYAGMTISDLYNALGVTKPTVYYYFTDKHEIFDILCREATQICLSAIRETVNPALLVRERLQACLLEMVRRCIDCHYVTALMYRDRRYLHPETVEWLHGMSRGYYRDLYALLDEGKRAGVFDFGDAHVAARLMGGVVGFMYTRHDPSRTDTQVLAVELSGAMMKIILPTAPSPAARPAP